MLEKIANGVATAAVGTAGLAIGTVGLAVDAVKETVDTVIDVKQLYERAQEQNELNKKYMAQSIEKYSRTQIILEEEAYRLDEIADKIVEDYKKIGEIVSRDMSATRQAEQSISQVEEINFSNAFLGAVVGGSAVAGGAVALVTTFCTAGTGAAISGLSGIFAAKATLAALGGGTLASGGLGIAGGVAVGTALFAIPALAVGGFIAHQKVLDTVKKVNATTKKVEEAIKLNEKLGKRNEFAAEKIRRIYDLGVTIDFFLHNLQHRLKYAPDKIKPDMQKIVLAVRSSLVETFINIEPFTEDKLDISDLLDKTTQQIENDCWTLQSILNERKESKIYTSRDINSVFQKVYSDAKGYVYMSYPWFNDFCVRQDLPLINRAIERGVKFYICYGFGDDDKYQKTAAVINHMKEGLVSPDAVKFVRVNSHRKVILCEKYVLYGSQNMMTYRYNEERSDKRDEVTVKVEDTETVEEFKKLILEQKI